MMSNNNYAKKGEIDLRIALLEDDVDLANLMKLWLEAEQHECTTFGEGEPFIRSLGRESYDLLIIDWMLPDTSGDEVLRWVREHIDWPIPVLFATQRDSKEDIVKALELGADDYMVKPVNREEMMARVNALGRRAQLNTEKKGTLEAAPYIIDFGSRRIAVAGKAVELTQKEFDLASFLFRNIGRVISRGHILESVWGQSSQITTRTVDTHISRIRNKLELSPENGWKLSAIYQHGYRLERLEQEV